MKKAIHFLISQAITLFGSQVVAFAIIWYITRETSSGVWVALMTISSFLPQFLMSFPGGVMADRYPKKRLIIGADAAIAILTLAMILMMPSIHQEGGLRVGLIILAALRSIAAGIQTPAVNAAIPLLVDSEHLMRVNGLNSTFQSVANFAAPAVAGAVMSQMSLSWAMMIDVATAIVGIAIVAFLCIPEIRNANEVPASPVEEKTGLASGIKEAIRYSRGNRSVGMTLLLFGIFIFLSVPSGFMCSLYVCRYLGDSYLNLMSMELMGFAGMLAGGVLMSTWGGFKNRFKTLCIAVALFGALGIGLGLSRNLVMYLVLMLLYGIPLTSFQTTVSTILQETADPQMMGRVFGLLNAMYSGFLPLGMAVFGPMADAISLRAMMVGSNVLMLLVCIPWILPLTKERPA